jgi:hypothetical protein
MADQTTIYRDNAWRIADTLTMTDPVTGAESAVSGQTLEGWLAATAAGDEIHPDLRIPLTENGTSGVYSGILDDSSIAAHLATYTVVYEIVRSSDGDYRTWKKRAVKPNRPAA